MNSGKFFEFGITDTERRPVREICTLCGRDIVVLFCHSYPNTITDTPDRLHSQTRPKQVYGMNNLKEIPTKCLRTLLNKLSGSCLYIASC